MKQIQERSTASSKEVLADQMKLIKFNLEEKTKLDYTELVKLVNSIDSRIRLASTVEDLFCILDLRKSTYANHLPAINFGVLEPQDLFSFLLLSESDVVGLDSTSRFTLDNPMKFAESYVYKPESEKLRESGAILSEWGRCIVEPNSRVRATDYARMVRGLGKALGVDYTFVFNMDSHVPKVLKVLKTASVLRKTEITLGGQEYFNVILWQIQNLSETAFWDRYGDVFLTSTSVAQDIVLRAASEYLYGNVFDAGSGCAKISPYLNPELVNAYQAIDASSEMVALGRRTLEALGRTNYRIDNNYIEQYDSNKDFDTAVSINSIYVWPDPQVVLAHIFNLLKPGGTFVLASINEELDMKKLAEYCMPGLLMHPDGQKFKSLNLEIEKSNQTTLYSLSELIKFCMSSGFEVTESHSKFYIGMLSFIVLKKPTLIN